MQMMKKQRNGLVELSLEGAADPFEDPRLAERTNFSRARPEQEQTSRRWRSAGWAVPAQR